MVLLQINQIQPQKKTIPDEKGKKYAEKIKGEWTSTSAVIDGKEIEDFIEKLFIKYYNANFNFESPSPLSIAFSSTKNKQKGCCGGGSEK